MVSAIITFQNECRLYQIAYNEISEVTEKHKIICLQYNNSIIYAVLLNDTNNLNIICSNILNQLTRGSVVFLKITNSQIDDMDYKDISNILQLPKTYWNCVDQLQKNVLQNEISQSVDNLSCMVDKLCIVENSENEGDLQESDNIYDYFDNCGYDSN
jgi:hypothetical protein